MNLTKEQVETAIGTGLALTNPESDQMIPVKLAAGVLILRQLLIGIGGGQITLAAATVEDPGTPPATPNKGPAPRRGAKKSRKPRKSKSKKK